MDLMQRARELTGKQVEITFADGGTERGRITATWTAGRSFTLTTGRPPGRPMAGSRVTSISADYEIDGTGNSGSGGDPVPAIIKIERV